MNGVDQRGTRRDKMPRIQFWGALLSICLCCGCAALHPIKGVPARYLPCDLKGPSRSGKKTIDLSLLRQTPPKEYLVGSGDVLAIYIEGILGRRDELPPVHFPLNDEAEPSFGFPVPVRGDGTIAIPMCDPIPVSGLTLRQVEDAISHALTKDKEILQPGHERILVSLQKPRQYRVLVMRQEGGNELGTVTGPGTLNLGSLKRGAGRIVSLPAYKNDVLHALAETGGLPGLDAENAIYIFRRRISPYDTPPESERQTLHAHPKHNPSNVGINRQSGVTQVSGEFSPDPGWGHSMMDVPEQMTPVPNDSFGHTFSTADSGGCDFFANDSPTIANSNVIRIPVRIAEGEQLHFTEQDIILQDGDVVFIESRDTEVFYTGGLLGGGQYTLPRDYDLDVLGAVSIAQSGQNQSAATRAVGGVSALNQDVTIGASQIVVLRQMPNGTQVPISINLYRALRNPADRIRVQPGDYIMLQYTRTEAFFAFIERHLLEGSLFTLAASQGSGGN